MLKLAIQAGLPLIHVNTQDLINVEEVLTWIAGEPVKPLNIPPEFTKITELKVPTGRVHFCATDCKSLVKLYHFCVMHEKTIIFVNTEKSVLQFDGGQLVPPKDLVLKFLSEISNDPDELLPAFGGLTLKDVAEVSRLTMTRDQSLTVGGVSATRRGYSNAKGIQQVDTDLGYYVVPQFLGTWIEANKSFFKRPKHSVLTPRGLLLDGPPGCIARGSKVLYRRGKRNGSRSIALENLYRRFNNIPDGKNMPRLDDAPTYLHSMKEDGSLFYNQVMSITKSGLKGCVRVVTSSGDSLVLTPDHPVCLQEGKFVPAGSLIPGMIVRMKGSMVPTGSSGKKKREIHRREICVKHHPIAGVKMVEGYEYRRLHFSRVVIEAHMNKLELKDYIHRLNVGELDGLVFLSSDQEVHHMDEDVTNDTLSNLVVMSKVEHAKHHGKLENFQVEYVVDVEVTSVEPYGEIMTYDVQMAMPCHNFVVENFIVHNTGKTMAAKFVATEFGVPLYRLDVGAMKGKYVGDSESNLLAAIAQVDQVEPCIPYDVMLQSSLGPLSIGELYERQHEGSIMVQGVDPESLELCMMKLHKVIKREDKKKIFTIKTETGVIRCTGNHKLLCTRQGSQVWVEAQDLQINDELVEV